MCWGGDRDRDVVGCFGGGRVVAVGVVGTLKWGAVSLYNTKLSQLDSIIDM